jgi:carbon starvation protein
VRDGDRVPVLQRVPGGEGRGAGRRAATPACGSTTGRTIHPTNKWVLFGHHFAAISGAGRSSAGAGGAVRVPAGLLWIVIGVCLGGAVQDFLVLAPASAAAASRWRRSPSATSAESPARRDDRDPVHHRDRAGGLGKVVVKALGGRR